MKDIVAAGPTDSWRQQDANKNFFELTVTAPNVLKGQD